MTIQWKDSFKIGNAAIDAQHQVWFARINSFLEATDGKSLQYCEVMMNRHNDWHQVAHHHLLADQKRDLKSNKQRWTRF